MGVPTSEVGYTSAIPRREDHEVRKGHVGGIGYVTIPQYCARTVNFLRVRTHNVTQSTRQIISYKI